MTTRMFVIASVLAAVLIPLVAGCGGSSSGNGSAKTATTKKPGTEALSGAAYAKQTNALVDPVFNAYSAWYHTTKRTQYRPTMTRLQHAAATALAGLNQLTPPPTGRAIQRHMVADLAQLVRRLKSELARPRIRTASFGEIVQLGGRQLTTDAHLALTIP